MSEIADIFVGFDQREAVAYHTFVQSIIDNSSIPVRFLPLNTKSLSDYTEVHNDGSNDFIYSRFLVPYMMDFKGWAIYADGDMVCLEDIKKLWDQRDNKFAVQVVKHNYKTKIKNILPVFLVINNGRISLLPIMNKTSFVLVIVSELTPITALWHLKLLGKYTDFISIPGIEIFLISSTEFKHLPSAGNLI